MALTRTSRRGATALEFVLALPVFLMVVLGVAEVSHYMSSLYLVQRAARDGARVGAVTLEGLHPTGDQIVANAEAQAKFVLNAGGRPCNDVCTVTADWTAQSDGFYYVTVYVAEPHKAITPGLGLVPAHATATFTMLAQQQP